MHARTTHSTGTTRQNRHGWSRWHITWSVAIVVALGLALISSSPVQAKTFQCGAGDVRCLIEAITEANANQDDQNAIHLEAGRYALVDVNNMTDGPNGWPSIVGHLTITGAGVDLTMIERNLNTHSFRLAHVAATGTLTLDGLTIQYFSESPPDLFYPGGALYNRGTLTLSNSAVLNNYTWGPGVFGGGGVYNEGSLTLLRTVVADNRAHYNGGGLVNAGGIVRISQSSIARNGCSYVGGGIYNTQGGTLTLTNTAVIENGSLDAGGLANTNGLVTITNSTFAGNYTAYTGAISNGGTLTLLNTTIAENSGSFSGGLYGGGTTVLVNTILARNMGEVWNATDCGGVITSQGNNLIGDLTGCTVTLQPTDRLGEPGLGVFSDDETPGDAHYPLLSTSQAINRGNPAVCPKTDQLGEKRDKLCDIGAIEFQGTAVSSR